MKTSFGVSFPLIEGETTPSSRSQLSKGGARPPFDRLKFSHKQNEGGLPSRQGTQCSNCDKNRRTQTSPLNSKGLVAHVPSSFCDTEAILAAAH